MEQFDRLTKSALMSELRNVGLPTTGKVNSLRKRMKEHWIANNPSATYQVNQVNAENTVDSLSDHEIEDEIKKKEAEIQALRRRQLNSTVYEANNLRPSQIDRRMSVTTVNSAVHTRNEGSSRMASPNRHGAYGGDNYGQFHPPTVQNMFSFRDIEGSLNTFSGSDNFHVEYFIKEFEQQARMLRWNDEQKVVYAKRLLRGHAKMLVRTVFVATWDDLREELLNEFGRKLSSNEVHQLLRSTKKNNKENVREYVLRMREIGLINDIDEESVVQYIIDGIDDSPSNKAMLYGCNQYNDLKYKLVAYEKFKSATTTKKDFKSNKDDTKNETGASKKAASDESRCFLCGERNHMANLCPTKEKGFKCFKCNTYGHKSSDNVCKPDDLKKVEAKRNDAKKVMCVQKQNMKSMKEVMIGENMITALIDTGSDINIIRHGTFKKLNLTPIKGAKRELNGAGGSKIITDLFFEEEVSIDGEIFKTKIHVVSDADIPVDMIIGNELLFKVDVHINKGSIVIKKCEENEKKDEEPNFLMHITVNDVNELDAVPDVVKTMIDEYKPKQTIDTNIELKLQLCNETPVYHRPRRLAFSQKEAVEKQIHEWIKEGVVEEGSSDFASSVVVVKKKDGTDRVCIDYRDLNKKIIKDRFPLPHIDDILDAAQSSSVFSTIDLKNGFFHVPVHKDSQKYLSFITHSGQYIFKRTPFGCCNSPAAFLRFINEVFRELIKKKIILVYMDDVVVLAANEAEAIERLKMVFDCASNAGLNISWKKCQFLRRSIEFLGHVIGNGEVKPSREKSKAVKNFLEPTSVKKLQSFLGLTGFFRKFIKDYAIIAKPLTDLLRKNADFKFDKEQRSAFETLKSKLSSDSVLKIFQQEAETQLWTDASKYGFGMILMQRCSDDGKFHPVYFMSLKTSELEEKYDSYTLETLAVIKALDKFRIYLLGRKFKIITDCQAFQKTMTKKDVVPKIARWVMKMQDFDYEIEHRTNDQMKHVDALSRDFAMIVVSKDDNLIIKVKQLQQDDENIKRITLILQNQPDYENYILRGDVLFKYIDGRELLVVPRAMQTEIIKNAHENGHFATKKVEEIVIQQFFIDKLKEKILKVINNCIPCILSERKYGKGEGFLNPIDKGDRPLDTYHIDHIGPMDATVKMYKYLFVVVDGFSKFVWIYPTKTTNTKEALDKLKIQQQHFGNPRRIISDKGSAFTSHDFKTFCEEEKIEHLFTTTGLPRANGQVERINRCIIPILTKMSLDDQKKWYKNVPMLQQALNSTFQRSIASSPFKLLFGVDMRKKTDIRMVEALEENFVKQYHDQRENERKDAKIQIQKVQQENASTFNSKRKAAKSYGINELVAIKRTQYINGTKLGEKYFGPYKIAKIKPNRSYDVKKVGYHDGPTVTSTTAEYLKKWSSGADD